MAERKCIYIVEGECEEKLIGALKEQPSLIKQGKIKRFNVIQNELKKSLLMTFAPGSTVILVFDTDVEITDALKKNIELLKEYCSGIDVMTVAEVRCFEDEIERSTDVSRAEDLTKSANLSGFKAKINRMNAEKLRIILNKHSFNIEKLWIKDPPKSFGFLTQDGRKIKTKG